MANSIKIPIYQNQDLQITCFDEYLNFGEWVQTPQSHSNCEIGFFVSGNISVVIENNLFFNQYGNILTIAPDETHMGKILESCKFEYFQFDIPVEIVHFLGDEPFLLDCFFNRSKGEKNMIYASSSATERIFGKLYEIKNLINSVKIDRKILCFSYFIQIMSLVNESFNNPIYTSLNAMKKVPSVLEKVMTVINSEYKILFSLDDIADKASISKSYLIKLFKQYIGFTPYQFLLIKKITHAKIMLREGANVTEACYESGFNDYSNFIALFKQAEGETPLKYKMKNRNNRHL